MIITVVHLDSDQRWECYFAIIVRTLIFCFYRPMDRSVYSQFDTFTVETTDRANIVFYSHHPFTKSIAT